MYATPIIASGAPYDKPRLAGMAPEYRKKDKISFDTALQTRRDLL